jgi:DNA-binding MarR family transcriptional regulator
MSADITANDRLTLERQVCFALAVASRDVVSLYRPILEPLGLTHPQYLVMVSLWEHDRPMSVKELSSLLRIDPPTLSPLLKRLQAAGLIERQRNPADERSLRITVTARGQELRESAEQVPGAIFERLGMSIEDLAVLHDVLTRVIDHANVRNGSKRDGSD